VASPYGRRSLRGGGERQCGALGLPEGVELADVRESAQGWAPARGGAIRSARVEWRRVDEGRGGLAPDRRWLAC
jgi:hypothetical protein